MDLIVTVIQLERGQGPPSQPERLLSNWINPTLKAIQSKHRIAQSTGLKPRCESELPAVNDSRKLSTWRFPNAVCRGCAGRGRRGNSADPGQSQHDSCRVQLCRY